MTGILRPIAKCASPLPPSLLSESSVQLSQALSAAKDDLEASAADLAKWCGVSPKTMERYLSGESPVRVDKVMRSRRLYPVFARRLGELLERRAA